MQQSRRHFFNIQRYHHATAELSGVVKYIVTVVVEQCKSVIWMPIGVVLESEIGGITPRKICEIVVLATQVPLDVADRAYAVNSVHVPRRDVVIAFGILVYAVDVKIIIRSFSRLSRTSSRMIRVADADMV
jgi:hypothetical protein